MLPCGGMRVFFSVAWEPSPNPSLFQHYHSALRVSKPSLRKAIADIQQAATNGGWAPPPRGDGSAAPLQCEVKVVGYGGPGPPLPHAEIGGPGRLLVLFAASKSTLDHKRGRVESHLARWAHLLNNKQVSQRRDFAPAGATKGRKKNTVTLWIPSHCLSCLK